MISDITGIVCLDILKNSVVPQDNQDWKEGSMLCRQVGVSCHFHVLSSQVSQRTISKFVGRPNGSDIVSNSIVRLSSTRRLRVGICYR
jgi:hypothetical protein